MLGHKSVNFFNVKMGVFVKGPTLSKLGQLALKIIFLRVIRKLIIIIKYVTKGVNFGVTA